MNLAEQLLQQVCATPEDDSPRAVFADHLLQQGQPRGEFIQRSLRGASARALAALVRANREALLGGLAPFVKRSGLGFGRGFLTKCTLRQTLPALPETALLEDVAFDWNDAAPAVDLRSLRRARGVVRHELVPRLVAGCPRLERLETYTTYFHRQSWAEVREHLLACPDRAVPELDLLVRGEDLPAHLPQLWAVPLVRAASTLTLRMLGAPPALRAGAFSPLEGAALGAVRLMNVGTKEALDWHRGERGWARR